MMWLLKYLLNKDKTISCWLICHTLFCFTWLMPGWIIGAENNKRCRQLRDQVIVDSKFNPEIMFRLLLNIGQYEFKLREVKVHSFVISLFIWNLFATLAVVIFCSTVSLTLIKDFLHCFLCMLLSQNRCFVKC